MHYSEIYDFATHHVCILVYRTLVVLLRFPLVPEILHGGAPEVFSHSDRLKNRLLTLTVLVRLKTH